MVVGIEIRVMDAHIIVERILNHFERGNSDARERYMIPTFHVFAGHFGSPKDREGIKQLFKDGDCRQVALAI